MISILRLKTYCFNCTVHILNFHIHKIVTNKFKSYCMYDVFFIKFSSFNLIFWRFSRIKIHFLNQDLNIKKTCYFRKDISTSFIIHVYIYCAIVYIRLQRFKFLFRVILSIVYQNKCNVDLWTHTKLKKKKNSEAVKRLRNRIVMFKSS